MDNKKIKIAAIGLGWVTTHRHLPTIASDPRFELVGLIDQSADRLNEVAACYRGIKTFAGSSIAAVPWIDEVDAVSIGTSPFAHCAIATEAMGLGKHVITEKPFAMSVEEGSQMVRVSEQTKRILGVVHNFQFSRSAKKLAEDLAAGAFGRIRNLTAVQFSNPRRRLPAWIDRLPLGLFYDESPHLLYLLRRFSPGALRFLGAEVFPSTLGTATPASVIARYACRSAEEPEIPVTMILQFESPISEWHLLVQGDEALGDIDVFRDIYVKVPNDGAHTTKTVIRTSIAATTQHWFQHFVSGPGHLTGQLRYGNPDVFGRFAEAVLSGQPPQAVSGHDALAVLRMQHEIVESGGKSVGS